jgi:hypothetical protein
VPQLQPREALVPQLQPREACSVPQLPLPLLVDLEQHRLLREDCLEAPLLQPSLGRRLQRLEDYLVTVPLQLPLEHHHPRLVVCLEAPQPPHPMVPLPRGVLVRPL